MSPLFIPASSYSKFLAARKCILLKAEMLSDENMASCHCQNDSKEVRSFLGSKELLWQLPLYLSDGLLHGDICLDH